MTEKTVTVPNPTGLHARPAAEFVRRAGAYSSQVFIAKNSKRVDGKSILGVMSLAIRQGDEIVIAAEGSDEEQAVDELSSLIAAFED